VSTARAARAPSPRGSAAIPTSTSLAFGSLRAGFTLVELLAVLVMFGLLAGIALPNLGLRSARALDDEAKKLASSLEFARQRAVMTGVPHRVLLDLDRGAYRIEWIQPAGEDEAEAAPGERALAMAPPAEAERAFAPLAGTLGEVVDLGGEVSIEAVETPEGAFDEGVLQVLFESDGTAEPAAIVLAAGGTGQRLALGVAPLSDTVRFLDVGG
jgi:type II secretion system protein H